MSAARRPAMRQGRSLGEPTYAPEPGTVPHPGSTLQEWLKHNGHTQLWLANQMNWEPHQVSRLVNGHTGFSVETAIRLGRITGLPPHFWMYRQVDYQISEALLGAKAGGKP